MSIRYLATLVTLAALPSAGLAQGRQPISRTLPSGAEVVRDIIYAEYEARSLQLDLYRPSSRSRDLLPTIVVIRGGGWRSGDKEGFGPMAAALATRGFAAVSIEYRTSDEATFPAAVHDTKAAVRWVRANAEAYGLDPLAIGAIGGSAGAHLAVYLGVTAGQSSLEGFGGHPDESSTVSAVVGLATPADLTRWEPGPVGFLGSPYDESPTLWQHASPTTHVSESSPPALLIHSEADTNVPFQQSLQLAGEYGANGTPVEVVLIPDAPHAFWNFDEWFDDTMDRSAAFFRAHLDRRR